MGLSIRGTGAVEIPAYGVADAEATVEKELRAIFPNASIQIRGIRRVDATARIVETFEVVYALRVPVQIERPDEPHEKTRQRAITAGRRALLGTRYEKLVWEKS